MNDFEKMLAQLKACDVKSNAANAALLARGVFLRDNLVTKKNHGGTGNVWFCNIDADGFTLDDKGEGVYVVEKFPSMTELMGVIGTQAQDFTAGLKEQKGML